MDISVIIVNYKSRHLLLNCISSIAKNLTGGNWEAIVVNNDFEPIDDMFIEDKNVRILNICNNVGFGRACNLGSKIANGKILFFLNPDTEIINISIKTLLKKFSSNKIGIIAPKVLLPNKIVQPWSVGKKLTLPNMIANKLDLARDISADNRLEYDWVSGASLLITKNLFLKKKGFDENFFMYFEDMDLCTRIKLSGYKIIRISEFSVLHIGGQSYKDSKQQKDHYYLSQDYYLKKHFGKTTALAGSFLRKIFLILK